ncbi:hypothetical protein I1A49_30025 [Streptomyces malaysiensis subsp. malaysiensis]|uniref:Uncharacterized protein n=1 Tax=Streptomyces malaysiensis TaxID=92644 RepID=A0ABX6WD70_STRMQ|nr:hypothetical protein [Streptomyces solisilvae]QPI58579.1 hypothetical protein I1A49_30025 [Streptomyces solisilvae]
MPAPLPGVGDGGAAPGEAPFAVPSAPEASSLRCAFAVSSRSRCATWAICRVLSSASSFSMERSCFFTLSCCFFRFTASDSCLSSALLARVATVSARRSPLVSRWIRAASRPAARSSSRASSAASSGWGVSRVSRKP